MTPARINPHIAITPVNALLDDAELAAMIAEHDLVLDCTDNVAVRNQLNAGCFAAKVPLVSGAAIRMEGQITVFTYQDGEPCYRCLSRLFGENALTCVEAGVMAPLIGVIGSLQAMEAIAAGRLWQTYQRENRHVRCDDLSVSRNETDA